MMLSNDLNKSDNQVTTQCVGYHVVTCSDIPTVICMGLQFHLYDWLLVYITQDGMFDVSERHINYVCIWCLLKFKVVHGPWMWFTVHGLNLVVVQNIFVKIFFRLPDCYTVLGCPRGYHSVTFFIYTSLLYKEGRKCFI